MVNTIENTETNRILSYYKKDGENMLITDDNFNETKLSELSNEFLNYHIDDLKIYLSEQKNKDWKSWSSAWLYIYENEILRRRTIKIKKIRYGLT